MNEYLKKGIVVLLALSLNNTVFGQQDSIDVYVKDQMIRRHIPGLQLAIVRNGKTIKTGNYGLANLQDSISVTDKTIFTINSITKAFTGVAILQLAEAGKIDLSSPASRYLPELPEAWKMITIQQLLSHTSGIPDIIDEESVLIASSPDEAWKKVMLLPVDFTPGEKFSYNQTNYLILGKIIHKLSGMAFQEFITKEQLSKVRMTKTIHAGFGATKDVIPHSASGYRYSQGKFINLFFSFPPYLQTAAGMSSTAKEIADWIIALQDLQLLKQRSSLDLLWKPATLNSGKTAGFGDLLNGYAAGWPVLSRKTHPAFASVGGGRSAVFVYPNDDLSIVVLTNLAGSFPESFIDEIAGFFIPDMKEANGFGLSETVKLIRARLEKSGYKNALTELKSLRNTNTDLTLNENEINSWGYKLMEQNRISDAIEIFKLNVTLFPTSANVYDSLGEAYAEAGNTELAIKNYEQSLKLNPGNTNAEQELKKLQLKKVK